MRGYAYHKIVGLLVALACGRSWLVAGVTASFYSALAATLEEEEACFLIAEKSGTAW